MDLQDKCMSMKMIKKKKKNGNKGQIKNVELKINEHFERKFSEAENLELSYLI